MPPTFKELPLREQDPLARLSLSRSAGHRRACMSRGLALALNCLAALWSTRAVASDGDMLILPTVIVTGGDCESSKKINLPPIHQWC